MPTPDLARGAATTLAPTVAPTTTTTTVICDDRPIIRLALEAIVRGIDGLRVVDRSEVTRLPEVVRRTRPGLLVLACRENDPDPFRAVAAARALSPDTQVVAIVDAASVVDLREAVVAGVDSLLLSTAPVQELRRACEATAAGERVVSPQIALQLAGSWRPASERSQPAALTPRELEVLQLLAEGMTNQIIGDRLGVSPRTIKTHVQNLLSKLDTPDRTGAVARGFRLGLIR